MSQNSVRGSSVSPFSGKKPSSNDLQKATGGAIQKQSDLSRLVGDFGKNQFNLAGPAYEKSLGFYEKLLNSSASQREALAPAITNITEGGRGARGAIRNRFARSGARDMAFAEEGRGRQADINKLLSGAPLAGVEGLSKLSGEGLQRALQSYGLSGDLNNSVGQLALEANRQEEARKEKKRGFWASIGNFAAKGIAGFLMGGPVGAVAGVAGASIPGKSSKSGNLPGVGPNPNLKGLPQ